MARLGDALELVLASILEREPGAGDEISGGSGHEHVTRSGDTRHTRADMYGDAAWLLITYALDLTSVDAGSHLESELVESSPQFERASDRSCRAVEENKEAVTSSVDLVTLEALELVANRGMVPFEQLAPRMIAQFACPVG